MLDWFTRYLEAVVLPILWLDSAHGITLEAHQQNTLVVLDAHGLPEGGRYRDNQGYYFRESALAHLADFAPRPGEDSDTVVADAIVDERLTYYVGVNNLIGMIGALGATALVDERQLLRRAREVLGRFAASRQAAGRAHRVTERCWTAATLPCKANLLTRVAGLDELVGPLETQSVYVADPEPAGGAVAMAITERRRRPAGARLAAAHALRPVRDGAAAAAEGPGRAPPLDERPGGGRLLGPGRPARGARPAHRRAARPRRTPSPASARLDGEPMSYWEVYQADQDPLAAYYSARRGDVGVHVLIGPGAYRGRGVGTTLIRAVADWALSRTASSRVVAEPDLRNERSIRAFTNAGFEPRGVLDLPDKQAMLMVYDRTLIPETRRAG